MDIFIKKAKIFFSVAVFSAVLMGVLVGSIIKNTPQWSFDYATHKLSTIRYKVDYAGGLNAFLANVPEAFSKQIQYEKNITASIPVLVYHGIPNESDNSLINITSENFKQHMFALKRAGYTTITTPELYSYLQGKIKLPEKSIMITFDDGRIDSYKIADPILDALNFKAVMFTIGRYPLLDERNKYYLSINELKDMNNSGRWDVEAHSYDGHNTYYTSALEQNGHFFSHKIWLFDKNRLETDQEFDDRIQSDLRKVQSDLGKALNKTINSFAFPYGDFGQNSTNFAGARTITLKDTSSKYNLSFYQIAPEIHFTSNYFIPEDKSSPFFNVRRMNINPQWSGQDLVDAIAKGAAKTLPFSDDFTKDNGWIRVWGKLNINPHSLTLSTEPNETGGSIILDGSRMWNNYSLKASITDRNSNSGVYVWTRFQDDSNNLSCNFGKNYIHIEQTLNGIQKVIQGTDYTKDVLPAKDFTVTASVNGRNITCNLNNTLTVSSQFADEKLGTGGIGFKTWQPVIGASSFNIKDINVTPL